MQYMCEQCNTSLQIPDEFAGKEGGCKNCGARFVVPPAPQQTSDVTPKKSGFKAVLLGVAAVCLLVLGVAFGIQLGRSESDSTPKVPKEVMTAIRENAERQHPGNKEEQNTTIAAQIEAYHAIKNYSTKAFSNEELNDLRFNAERNYPGDYVRQKDVLDTVSNASAMLKGLEAAHNIQVDTQLSTSSPDRNTTDSFPRPASPTAVLPTPKSSISTVRWRNNDEEMNKSLISSEDHEDYKEVLSKLKAINYVERTEFDGVPTVWVTDSFLSTSQYKQENFLFALYCYWMCERPREFGYVMIDKDRVTWDPMLVKHTNGKSVGQYRLLNEWHAQCVQ
ncbi:MAG: hypothetical protein AMXMBFR82_53380 [Candidatus Hydrogenedentota bacterium]